MSSPHMLTFGDHRWDISIPAESALTLRRSPPLPARDVSELLDEALQSPLALNAPLRRAFTPDDIVAIVLDERAPQLGKLLAGVLNELTAAGVGTAQVTLLVPTDSPQNWIDDLPDEFGDVTIEVHQPANRDKLAYLATTKTGQRIYLNRTLVDADVAITIAAVHWDSTGAEKGGPALLYPALADAEAIASKKLVPGTADEVLRLLGSVFLIHAIESAAGGVAEVVVGFATGSAEAVERHRSQWTATLDEPADLAIAVVPHASSFAAFATAAANAQKIVAANGRIALLTADAPVLDEASELMRKSDTPALAFRRLASAKPADPLAANLWLLAAGQSHLFVASGWTDEATEELFATPLRSAGELQRLIDAAKRVVVLPDADKLRPALDAPQDAPE